MATAAADEHIEAMEEVVEEERAAEAVEEMEQVEEEERAGGEAETPAEEGAEASDEGHVEAMEQVEVDEEVQAEAAAAEVQAEAAEEGVQGVEAEVEALSTVLPLGRVKKIMRVDRDIKKVTAEASLLIAAATELFLGSLAAGARTAASQRGRRAVRAADVRAAARAHRPTADFLLDCLPAAQEVRGRSGSDGAAAAPAAAVPKPLPRGTRRIDGFFQKVT